MAGVITTKDVSQNVRVVTSITMRSMVIPVFIVMKIERDMKRSK
jgi:hypothetical protein